MNTATSSTLSPCDCDDKTNCIAKIKTFPFRQRNFQEKLSIINIGRPTPNLNLMQKQQKTCRYFNMKFYDNFKWLAGCKHENRMYCWPCFLFSKEKTVWSDTGYVDLNNFSNAAKKHDQSQNHLKAILALHNFGETRIETSISQSYRETIERHNAKVDRNRNIMRRLIDITCFLAKQELPFRGHDETADSSNCGNFLECAKLLANYDGLLEDHLQSIDNKYKCAFSGLSNRIQNDLVLSIAATIRKTIKKEVEKAEFVAVMVDESPDISCTEQLCIILRYFKNNEVEDRFLEFIDVSGDRTANALTAIILSVLDQYKCKEKLIGQTYDGASVLSSEKNGVQKKIREVCPNATFVWCSAHILNLVLSKSCQRISETKQFFTVIKNLGSFFHTSPKRTDFYKQFCISKKLPRVVITRWSYNSRTVNVIYSERKHIIELLENMCENEKHWDGDTVLLAKMFLTNLSCFEFNYFLSVFNSIFVETDVLFNIIQSKTSDIAYCMKKIGDFELSIDSLYDKFDLIYSTVLKDCGEPERNRKIADMKLHYRRILREIVDNIKSEITSRYQSLNDLEFFKLLDVNNFNTFKGNFPINILSILKKKWPTNFDYDRLKNELSCVYSSDEFKHLNAYEIIRYCHDKKLTDVFPELVRLGKLIVTIPASSASAERSFSALRRIHTYLRNTQNQTRLADLALIAIEKRLLIELKRTSNFYDNVLEEFLKKERRIDLTYKK